MRTMGTRSDSIDLAQARLDPGSVFSSPEAVVDDTALTGAEKADILRRWEYDASELAVAEEEGMTGGEPDLLQRALQALAAVTDDIDVEHTPPTKQGGIP